MVSVAIYVRLSDEDRNKQSINDESESIQNQKSMLTEYCKERNWDVYDIYCDEDYSGADSNRPDFNRMLTDCEKGKINIVLCKSQSRFSRDMEVIERYLHDKFIEWEVRFIGVVDHTDTSDIANKKSRQINGLVNEWYLEDVSENIRKTLQHKRESGEFTGSFAPYGYAIDPENKNHLIIDEAVASVVRDVFEWYSQGWGYRKIVMQLNSMGIPSPTLYKEQNNSKFFNANDQGSHSKGLWTHPTIYRMLRNETYTGTLVQGKSHTVSYKNHRIKRVPESEWIKVRGTHEAIISPELWEKVRERLSSKQRASNITQELAVLSGKVKCAECGKAMKRDVYYNKKRTVRYYQLICATYKTGAMNCDNTSGISGLQLEKVIVEQINCFFMEYLDRDKIQIENDYEERIKQIISAIDSCNALIADKQCKVERMYEDKLGGVISLEEYNHFKEKFDAEIEESINKTETLEAELKALKDSKNSSKRIEKIIDRHSHIEKLDRITVDELIDEILIGCKSEGQPRPITIRWNI